MKKVLVIGSGPIVIGQAAEFDYAGTQACTAIREEGITCLLVNSNPATIMTDEGIADITYIEPLTVESLQHIIAREHPDSLLATLGGQTGLNLAMKLAHAGVLEKAGVRLLGTSLASIQQAEDRSLFKELLGRIYEPTPPSISVNDVQIALKHAAKMQYPLIVRPAFTLGGTGGGIATTQEELAEVVMGGLAASPIRQVLIEQYLVGWKELEFEVLRDSNDTCIIVCGMENIDPMGVHTGDSIVVAPCQTLSDKDYHMLRTAALKIIRALDIEGGCNIQFALDPHSHHYYVIEVNPRVSRSSALASKVTGYPIARIATKIALGKTLEELTNPITGTTCAAFEPALDYVAVKIPRWPFDKFPQANRQLGTQMKATGEVMGIGCTFEAALQKAMRSLDLPRVDPAGTGDQLPSQDNGDSVGRTAAPTGSLAQRCTHPLATRCLPEHGTFPPTDERLWQIMAALRADSSLDAIDQLQRETGIDLFFLAKFQRLIAMEQRLHTQALTPALLKAAKRLGFSDASIGALSGTTEEEVRALRLRYTLRPVYKMVDTCAGEFEAQTPYFYSTYAEENEAPPLATEGALVLGSGPIRVGQGIEFDYCSVQAAKALRHTGKKSIMINCNPETVSTDFDISDRLYFEPLDKESILDVLENEVAHTEEKAKSTLPIIVQFGGQTAINAAASLVSHQAKLLGTSLDSMIIAEDRRQWDSFLQQLNIPRPEGITATSLEEACAKVPSLGFPLLIRPSYVLGGRAMEIIYNHADLEHALRYILQFYSDKPILIDRYLEGKEVEVDLIADGHTVLIPGIMEHIERAGVHSGDSSAIYPPMTLTDDEINTIVHYSTTIALALKVQGLLNIQYVLHDGIVYVLEVNPRASRTVPFLSKATGVPIVKLATQVIAGATLQSLGYHGGLYPVQPLVAVKTPVFSAAKLKRLDVTVGPEMKSTGEVMGIARSYAAAIRKAYQAAGLSLPAEGNVYISIADRDKNQAQGLVRRLQERGYLYTYYATPGTAAMLKEIGIEASAILKESACIRSLLYEGQTALVINTRTHPLSHNTHEAAVSLGFSMRRAAVEANIPCFTSLDTLHAAIDHFPPAGSSGIEEVRPFYEYRSC